MVLVTRDFKYWVLGASGERDQKSLHSQSGRPQSQPRSRRSLLFRAQPEAEESWPDIRFVLWGCVERIFRFCTYWMLYIIYFIYFTSYTVCCPKIQFQVQGLATRKGISSPQRIRESERSACYGDRQALYSITKELPWCPRLQLFLGQEVALTGPPKIVTGPT